MPASRAQRAATAKRRADAVNLCLAGLSYDLIADRLAYASRGAAHTDVQRALQLGLRERADMEVWRQELLMKLLRLQAAMWGAALSGDTKAGELALKTVDRIIKLTGADLPTRLEVITMGAVEAEIARLSKELGEQAGRGVPHESTVGGLLDGSETGAAP